MDKKILDNQSQHWEINFSSKPEMFGLNESFAAKKSLYYFEKYNIKNIVELGAGLGRDSIFFGRKSFKITSLDYSKSAIKNIEKKIKDYGIKKNISVKQFDVRKRLPFDDKSIDAFFSHMLFCMAITFDELDNLNQEIHRILKPNGLNIYTVRNEKDGDYKKGIHRGEDMYENDGFIVNFFSKSKIKKLLNGFENLKIEEFEEGSFPRKLYYIVNKKKN